MSPQSAANQERSPVPIVNIEALIIAVPAEGTAFADGEEETLLVRITDEDGTYGIGESVCTPQHGRLRELSRTLDPAHHELFLPSGARSA